jgi:hypothetical protein
MLRGIIFKYLQLMDFLPQRLAVPQLVARKLKPE